MSATKFFTDNLTRLSPQVDPLSYNLNQGLLAMAKQLVLIERALASQKNELASLESLVRRLPPR